jgi:two-component system, NarL family, invasion response regulator UvrY
MLRILVADDHSVVRRGLRQILETQPDIKVTAEAGTGSEAVAQAREQAFDVVVLDITMSGRSGLEVLRELKLANPAQRVLMLSMHPEDRYAIRVLRAGASGYLTKETAPEELVNAVRKVAGGGKYVSPGMAERLAEEIGASSDKPPHELLSDREFEIMRLLATGKTVSEIAAQLCIAVNTVSTYRVRVLRKLDLSNNAELMRYALHHHLVD